MKEWAALSEHEIVEKLEEALAENRCYIGDNPKSIFGLPGTILDRKIFNDPQIDEKGNVTLDTSKGIINSYLKVFFHNPNHIGNHTNKNKSEPFYKGTQKIENELLSVCAEKILLAEKTKWNGYVTTGGTEANIFALWMLRNYFIKSEKKATLDNTVIVCSEDTHYSIRKAADILSLDICNLAVDEERQIKIGNTIEGKSTGDKEIFTKIINRGKKFCIVVVNMGTTMYGSVDNKNKIKSLLTILKGYGIEEIKLHVDAAYGGFIYPLIAENEWHFQNEMVTSFTLDPHKILQVPYSTGIFLTRESENFIPKTGATYVPGGDTTLCGSRSGAAAVFAWSVLMSYGSEGGKTFLNELIKVTDIIDSGLNKDIKRFREKKMNCISIYKSQFKDEKSVKRLITDYGLHNNDECFILTIMDHIIVIKNKDNIQDFINRINNLEKK